MARSEAMGNGILTSTFELFSALLSGSVDIHMENHVFCMIVSIYMHCYASVLICLLFTWAKPSLVILEAGNYLRAEGAQVKNRGAAGSLMASESSKALQRCWQWTIANPSCSQELSVVRPKPLFTGLIYILYLLHRISIWGLSRRLEENKPEQDLYKSRMHLYACCTEL